MPSIKTLFTPSSTQIRIAIGFQSIGKDIAFRRHCLVRANLKMSKSRGGIGRRGARQIESQQQGFFLESGG